MRLAVEWRLGMRLASQHTHMESLESHIVFLASFPAPSLALGGGGGGGCRICSQTPATCIQVAQNKTGAWLEN